MISLSHAGKLVGYSTYVFCKRNQQTREASCAAWLIIIGYKIGINCDALRILLAGVHYVDSSSDAND